MKNGGRGSRGKWVKKGIKWGWAGFKALGLKKMVGCIQ